MPAPDLPVPPAASVRFLLVTGGSRGIGAAVARQAAAAGWHVAVNCTRDAAAAAAVLWLLSDGASYTTGAIVDVAGGR